MMSTSGRKKINKQINTRETDAAEMNVKLIAQLHTYFSHDQASTLFAPPPKKKTKKKQIYNTTFQC